MEVKVNKTFTKIKKEIKTPTLVLQELKPPRTRTKRCAKRACDYCQRRKIRCDNESYQGKCSACTKKNYECTFNNKMKRNQIKCTSDSNTTSNSPTPSVENEIKQLVPLSTCPQFPTSLKQCREVNYYKLNMNCNEDSLFKQAGHCGFYLNWQKNLLANMYYFIPSEYYNHKNILLNIGSLNERQADWYFDCLNGTLGFFIVIHFGTDNSESQNNLESSINHYCDATMMIPRIDSTWPSELVDLGYTLLNQCYNWSNMLLSLQSLN
ncbi:hypothetical protein K502DRAFT_345524 [Neoconidiobolus thromboides FSU 785]|nr:hypothetical protein K502DRAFT_345524 [Neoconidiobolus thromboides FSU 785]